MLSALARLAVRHPRRMALSALVVFALSTDYGVFLKEIGLGAFAAVSIDAFVVRTWLVPSLMALLGRWNWWSPAPLARLHARLHLAES